jgi:nicotinic acid phosphoribosyltransferase
MSSSVQAKGNMVWVSTVCFRTGLIDAAFVMGDQVGAGGYMVLRPDSGDPVEAVLMVIAAAGGRGRFQ